MGTNFYAHIGVCKHCLTPKQQIHIGKASMGWTFSFHAIDEIRSYKDWLKQLKEQGVEIYDEYGKRWCLNDFTKIVDKKKGEKRNHAIVCKDERYDHSFLDNEGNSFTEGEFS